MNEVKKESEQKKKEYEHREDKYNCDIRIKTHFKITIGLRILLAGCKGVDYIYNYSDYSIKLCKSELYTFDEVVESVDAIIKKFLDETG